MNPGVSIKKSRKWGSDPSEMDSYMAGFRTGFFYFLGTEGCVPGTESGGRTAGRTGGGTGEQLW